MKNRRVVGRRARRVDARSQGRTASGAQPNGPTVNLRAAISPNSRRYLLSAEMLARFKVKKPASSPAFLVPNTTNGSRGSRPSRSASQSVLFTYNLEIVGTARVGGRVGVRVRTGEGFLAANSANSCRLSPSAGETVLRKNYWRDVKRARLRSI